MCCPPPVRALLSFAFLLTVQRHLPQRTNWLNDEIVNFHAWLVMQRDLRLNDGKRTIFAFSSFFWTRMGNPSEGYRLVLCLLVAPRIGFAICYRNRALYPIPVQLPTHIFVVWNDNE